MTLAPTRLMRRPSTEASGVWPVVTPGVGEIFNRRFFRTREYTAASIAGFSAAGIHLGYVVLFYLFGRNVFGFYTPLEVQYDDILSTWIPWASPLLVALAPAGVSSGGRNSSCSPVILKLS